MRLDPPMPSGSFSWGKIEWRKVFGGQPWVLLALVIALMLIPGAAYEFLAPHRDTYYSKPVPDSSYLGKVLPRLTITTPLLFHQE